MKFFLTLSTVAFSLMAQAAAAVISFEDIPGRPDPDDVMTAPELIVADESGTVLYDVVGNQKNKHVSPWGADSPNTYTSVQGKASLTYAFEAGYVNTFTLLWGSIDSYNDIEFFRDGQSLGKLNGADVRATLDGKGTSIIKIFLDELFDEVKLTSSTNAFEHVVVSAALEPVPVPGAVVLFGSALAGFGALRRRR